MDFCDELGLCATVNFGKLCMSRIFSELRESSYVGSAICPNCETQFVISFSALFSSKEK